MLAEGLIEKVNKTYGLSSLPQIKVCALLPFLLPKLGIPITNICWPEPLMNWGAILLLALCAQGWDRCLRSQRKSERQYIKGAYHMKSFLLCQREIKISMVFFFSPQLL